MEGIFDYTVCGCGTGRTNKGMISEIKEHCGTVEDVSVDRYFAQLAFG
jgi:hypothetical protein